MSKNRFTDKFMHQGYWCIRTNKGRLASVHRVLYRQRHGNIPKDWVVHHIDANKLNNDINNLIAIPERLHNTIHNFQRLPARHQIERYLKLYLNGERPDRKDLRKERSAAEMAVLEASSKKHLPTRHRIVKAPLKIAQTVEDFVKANPESVQKLPYMGGRHKWNGKNYGRPLIENNKYQIVY